MMQDNGWLGAHNFSMYTSNRPISSMMDAIRTALCTYDGCGIRYE